MVENLPSGLTITDGVMGDKYLLGITEGKSCHKVVNETEGDEI